VAAAAAVAVVGGGRSSSRRRTGAGAGCLSALSLHVLADHVKLERPQVPLATGRGVVVVGVLLDGHVGEVGEEVGDVGRVVRVSERGARSKSVGQLGRSSSSSGISGSGSGSDNVHVPRVREAREPGPVQVRLQRREGRHKNVPRRRRRRQ